MENVWLYSAIGGLTPALFWLFFWLREDVGEPEPKKIIAKTFFFGILAALFSLALQGVLTQLIDFSDKTIEQIISFAFIEELLKYLMVLLIVVKSVHYNEKTDPVIYMIVVALGFVALENTFYIVDYLSNFDFLHSLVHSSYRFVGATLVHIISSSLVGISIALVFFKKKIIRRSMAILGLLIATSFHTAFNFLINTGNSQDEKIAFFTSWFFIVVILIVFEYFNRVKIIRPSFY